jgi:hypothetical protein
VKSAEWRAKSSPYLRRELQLKDKAEDSGLTPEESSELEEAIEKRHEFLLEYLYNKEWDSTGTKLL